MQVFFSLKFDEENKKKIKIIESLFSYFNINLLVEEHLDPTPLPEKIQLDISSSDAFLVLITEENSVWVQNEIGMAYSYKIPIYAIVDINVSVEGILPYIVTYKKIDINDDKIFLFELINIALVLKEKSDLSVGALIYKEFKNKREALIFEIGTHAAGHQLFLLLMLNDINPFFYETYLNYHKNMFNELSKKLGFNVTL